MPGLLLVHAHPDDEVIGTGATMAKYAAAGIEVTLVTCTRGEEGEIIGDEQAHRAADRDDTLGEYRELELKDSLDALNVTHHYWLGHAGKYRDSGMMGVEANNKPGTFWTVDLDVPTQDLVRILRERRPEVVVTYDEFGGYGHPDHIRANQITMAAIEQVDFVQKLYFTAIPKSWLQAGIDAMKAQNLENMFGVDSADDLPFGADDAAITTIVTATDFIDNKFAAMRAHATQISTEGGFFALSDGVGREVMGQEAYILARGATGELDEAGHETDLFAGIV